MVARCNSSKNGQVSPNWPELPKFHYIFILKSVKASPNSKSSQASAESAWRSIQSFHPAFFPKKLVYHLVNSYMDMEKQLFTIIYFPIENADFQYPSLPNGINRTVQNEATYKKNDKCI